MYMRPLGDMAKRDFVMLPSFGGRSDNLVADEDQ